MSEIIEAASPVALAEVERNVETIRITTPTDATLSRPAQLLLDQVGAMEIDSAVMYACADDELVAIKRKVKTLNDERMSITRPLDESKARTMAVYRRPLELLEQAQRLIERKMLEYKREQERQREAEQTRLEELARKERERIEAQAAKAAEKGKIEKAETLRAEAAQIPVAVVLPAALPKIAGQSVPKTYNAEVTDFVELVRHVAANPQFQGLLLPNMPALNAQARSLKMAMQLPGVKVNEVESIRNRT